jgi:transcriptional regulator with XRE-family HTH domain
MTAPHSCYEELAAQRRDSGQYRAGYAEAGRTFLIGQAVRERRLALGLSQAGLAARAGMTQPALSRLEAGGAVPTIPLLERISAALDADLIVKIAPHAACAGAHRSGLRRPYAKPTGQTALPGIRRHDCYDGVKGPLSSSNAGEQGLTPLFRDDGVRDERTLTLSGGSQVQASPSSFA